MAVSILINNGKNILHTPQHDLESLLYILFNIFTSTDGPGRLRVIKGKSNIPLLQWFQDFLTYKQLGRTKQGQLVDFEYTIKAHFTDYWKPLAEIVQVLFRITFPGGLMGHAPPPRAQHAQMVTILNVTIALLSQSSDDNIFPRIAMPITKTSSSHCPRDGPIYPERRSASGTRTKAFSLDVVPVRKRSLTVAEQLASRAKAPLEEVPRRKRSLPVIKLLRSMAKAPSEEAPHRERSLTT